MESKRIILNGRWRALWFFLLLGIPALVVFLPYIQTSYEEDLLLLAICLYLFFRTVNERRAVIPEAWRAVVVSLIAGCVYSILWLGLMRGYLNDWGRFLALYPGLLFLSVWFHPHPTLDESNPRQRMIYTLIGTAVLLIGILSAWLLVFQGSLDSIYFSISDFVSPLMVIPIFGCMVLNSRCLTRLETGRDHWPLLLLTALVTVSVWTGNARTWLLWYRAGEFERAWTPFQYDSEPDKLAEVMKKPHQAAHHYQLVWEQIQKKGDLPRYLNWAFFMRYRMSLQAMRAGEIRSCLAFLSPEYAERADKIDFQKEYWRMESCWKMQTGEPDYHKRLRLISDVEMNPEKTAAYALDRWGRVYSYTEGYLWIEWEPEETFNDALDLEIFDGAFVILRRNGYHPHFKTNSIRFPRPPLVF